MGGGHIAGSPCGPGRASANTPSHPTGTGGIIRASGPHGSPVSLPSEEESTAVTLPSLDEVVVEALVVPPLLVVESSDVGAVDVGPDVAPPELPPSADVLPSPAVALPPGSEKHAD
jgi:hypothetical protein